MQLGSSSRATNLLPRAVLQQDTFNSKGEYSQRTLKWKVNQLLTYLRMQNCFWKNLLDVVFVVKCLTLRRNFWSIAMVIVFLHLMTYLLHCVDLYFKARVVKVQSKIQISSFI